MTHFTRIDDCVMHYDFREGRGPAIVFLNSLGTDLRIWDEVIEALPGDIAILRMDKRGHGLSQEGEASIERLAADAAALMDRFGLSGALICGVSIGGMIAQALTLARPDLVAGLVLSNTGAKIGDADLWNGRLEQLERDGLASMSDAVMERWFSSGFKRDRADDLEGYRTMLVRTTAHGYGSASRALRDCDLRERSGEITVPAICIAGTEDKATPPEMQQALAEALPDGRYVEIEGVGHLPSLEKPGEVARILTELHPTLAPSQRPTA